MVDKKSIFALIFVSIIIFAFYLFIRRKENLSFPLPGGCWTFIGNNFSMEDCTHYTLPSGSIILYPSGSVIPDGWISCDGTSTYNDYTGETYTTPDLSQSAISQYPCVAFATPAEYQFIIKNAPSSTSSNGIIVGYGPLPYSKLPEGAATLFYQSTPPNGWDIVGNSLHDYYSQITPFPSAQLSISPPKPDTLMSPWSDNYKAAVALFNQSQQTAEQQSDAVVNQFNSDIEAIYKSLFLMKKNDTPTEDGKFNVILDSVGNIQGEPIIMPGTIILWNNQAIPPPLAVWTPCDKPGSIGSLAYPELNRSFNFSTNINGWVYGSKGSFVPPSVSFYIKTS